MLQICQKCQKNYILFQSPVDSKLILWIWNLFMFKTHFLPNSAHLKSLRVKCVEKMAKLYLPLLTFLHLGNAVILHKRTLQHQKTDVFPLLTIHYLCFSDFFEILPLHLLRGGSNISTFHNMHILSINTYQWTTVYGL